MKALREELEGLTKKAGEAEEKAKQAWDQMYNYRNVLDTLNLGREKQSFHQANVDKIRKNLKERDESDEWLQSEIGNYEQRTRSREEQQQKLKKQYADFGEAISRFRERLSRKHAEIGRCEEQKATHEEQLETRNILIKETSRQHNIRGYETNLDDTRVQEYVAKVAKLSSRQQDTVVQARKEAESEIRKTQDALDSFNEQRSTFTAEQKSSKQQIMTNDQRIKVCRSELANMNIDEGELAISDAKIEQLEHELDKARRESRSASWDKSIQDQDARLRSLSEKTTLLKNELIDGTKHASELAQMEHLQKELADRQRNLEKLKKVHQSKLQTLLHHDWQPSILDAGFQNVVQTKAEELKDAEHQRALVSRDLDQIDLLIGSTEQNLRSGKMELDACEKRLRENLEGEPEGYPNEVSEIQSGRDLLKSDVNNFDNLREFYQKAIILADSKHRCKLCTRAFHDKTEKEEFVDFMNRKLEKDDEYVKSQDQLADQEEALRKAKSVGPAYETWSRLKRLELPKLGSAMKDLASRRAVVVRQLEDHDRIVSDLEQSKEEISALMKPVANITKFKDEISSFLAQIQDLKEKQKDAALPRTLKEIQEELDRADNEIRIVSGRKDRLSADKDGMRTKINSLDLQIRDEKTNLAKASYDLRDKETKLKQIDELNNANQIQRDKVRLIDNQLREVSPQIEAVQSQLEEVRTRGDLKEQTLRKEASHLSESVHKLEQADKRVHKYIEDGSAANLKRCQREIESLEREIQQTEDERNEIIKVINKITEELRGQEDTKRIIRDNLEYRTSLRELESLQKDIVGLEGQNAEADRDHWQAEASRWQNLYNKYSTLKTSKLSEARTKDDMLVRLVADWNTDYKDAALNYKKAHIEVEVGRLHNAVFILTD